MKGIVFSEFLDFVEHQFSMDQVEDMLDACSLESGGAYTSVGTYDHRELVMLLVALSKQTSIDANTLLYRFGHHLMGVFTSKFSEFFKTEKGLFEFLASVDDYIHVEVRKLYPDAELPKFTAVEMTERSMIMDYHSSRCLAPLAEGLLMGAAEHFKTPVTIQKQVAGEPEGSVVRFVIVQEGAR